FLARTVLEFWLDKTRCTARIACQRLCARRERLVLLVSRVLVAAHSGIGGDVCELPEDLFAGFEGCEEGFAVVGRTPLVGFEVRKRLLDCFVGVLPVLVGGIEAFQIPRVLGVDLASFGNRTHGENTVANRGKPSQSGTGPSAALRIQTVSTRSKRYAPRPTITTEDTTSAPKLTRSG